MKYKIPGGEGGREGRNSEESARITLSAGGTTKKKKNTKNNYEKKHDRTQITVSK